MRNLLIVFTFIIGGLIYSQNNDSLRIKKFQKEIDSIKCSKEDFDKFKRSLTQNLNIVDSIPQKIAIDSSSELDLLELSALSFEDAKIKYGEMNVKMIIHSYNMSKETLEKFRKLDSIFQAEKDSLNYQKEPFQKRIEFSDKVKKEIKKYKKQLDSLEKN